MFKIIFKIFPFSCPRPISTSDIHTHPPPSGALCPCRRSQGLESVGLWPSLWLRVKQKHQTLNINAVIWRCWNAVFWAVGSRPAGLFVTLCCSLHSENSSLNGTESAPSTSLTHCGGQALRLGASPTGVVRLSGWGPHPLGWSGSLGGGTAFLALLDGGLMQPFWIYFLLS